MHIGFLGLGHLGAPMARNLLGPEHTVTVYNRTPGKAKALVSLGAREAASIADAVKNAEVVITCLSDDAALNEVVHGPSGLLQNLPLKSIHLCMSTIGVETSSALTSAHAQAGQGYVAAPVFGRAAAAATRHIWIVAGGPEPQVNRCLPIFVALGRGHTRVGPNASLAHALKLGGNILTMAMELAVSEILTYSKKAGMPPADFLRILNTAVFRSHLVDDYGGATARPSLDPEDQTLDLAANEMLMQASRELGLTIPVADQLNARLQAAGARGWGEQDLAELAETCHAETDLELASLPRRTAFAPTPPSAPQSALQPAPSAAPQSATPAAPPAAPTATPPAAPSPAPSLAHPSAPTVALQIVSPAPPLALKTPLKSKKEMPSKTGMPRADTIRPQGRRGVEEKPGTPPQPGKLAPPPEGQGSEAEDPVSTYKAMYYKVQVVLDLYRTSHFEVIKGHVCAWSQGKRYDTTWRSLEEVEAAFKHVLFLPIKRNVLLRPDAVLDLRATFGGGAKALLGEGFELDIGRSTVPRLKELLGI